MKVSNISETILKDHPELLYRYKPVSDILQIPLEDLYTIDYDSDEPIPKYSKTIEKRSASVTYYDSNRSETITQIVGSKEAVETTIKRLTDIKSLSE